MNDPDFRPGLVSVASVSKKDVNQDAAAVCVNHAYPLAAVVVADGLGSHYRAEVGSRLVADTIAEGLRSLPRAQALDCAELFAHAHLRLKAEAESMFEEVPSDLDWSNAFGTTVVCAVETEERLTFAYSGNGGLFHVRGNFNTFPPSQLLPWSVLNYLNPHSIPRDGRNVMYKLIAPRSTADDVNPTAMTISKDDTQFGDIIICCTDGIYSYDQIPIGRDDRQNLWIGTEPAMSRLYAALGTFFNDEPTSEALDRLLQDYVAGLKTDGLVSDDCTVGVLITEKALAFQARLREKRMGGVPA